MERVRTNDLRGSNKSARQFLERSKIAQVFLKIIGVLGISLVMSGKKHRCLFPQFRSALIEI